MRKKLEYPPWGRNPGYSDSSMYALAYSEYPDEMPHDAALHQWAKFAKTKNIFRERKKMYLESAICDPSIYKNSVYETRRKDQL